MKTIILDYTDGKVKIFNHEKGLQNEDIEILLYDNFGLSESNIERMTVDELEIEELN